MADTCSGPVKFDGEVIGKITGCWQEGDYLMMEGVIEPDPYNERAKRAGDIVIEALKPNMAGISVEFVGGEPIGAEAFLIPSVPA